MTDHRFKIKDAIERAAHLNRGRPFRPGVGDPVPLSDDILAELERAGYEVVPAGSCTGGCSGGGCSGCSHER